MPRGDKSAYTDKQKRQAEHIEESYEEKGKSNQEAERIAWATVNKNTGGGLKKKTTKSTSTTLGKTKPKAKSSSSVRSSSPPSKTSRSKTSRSKTSRSKTSATKKS